MAKKILIGLVVILVLFFGYVSTRPASFHYERSGVIKATPEQIFPYLSQFKLGSEWSPFEKKDPNMKKVYPATDGPGAVFEFDGNKEVGSGKIEMMKITPNEFVQMKLTMTKPFPAENIIEYKLTPVQDGTKFTWSMSGDNGFLGKLISVFINCEKMIGNEFEAGISNLKSIVEAKKP